MPQSMPHADSSTHNGTCVSLREQKLLVPGSPSNHLGTTSLDVVNGEYNNAAPAPDDVCALVVEFGASTPTTTFLEHDHVLSAYDGEFVDFGSS